jgi:hypothetical protein
MAHQIISSPLPLEPGTYILRESVTNPKPDGRIKQRRADNWESWPEWKAGMKFIVDMDHTPIGKGMNRIYVWGGYHKASYTDPRYSSIIMFLDKIEEKPSELLARYGSGMSAGSYALEVLDHLNIPLSEIERAIAEIEALEEEQE